MSAVLKSPSQLIEEHQGLVRALAWRIHRNLPEHMELDDLIAYGQIGLAEAAQGFDFDRGNRFSTFAYYRVRGAIYDGLSKMGWFSRSQYQRIRFTQMANELLRLDGETSEETERTNSEDSDWLCGLTSALAVVYLATQATEDGESLDPGLADNSTPSPPSVAIGLETTQKLHELIAQLPAESGKLIRAVYFEGLSLSEAGQQIGVSKAWASRLHAKALGRLADSLRSLGLAEE